MRKSLHFLLRSMKSSKLPKIAKVSELMIFSNFSPHPFRLDGEEWKTMEHYYQSKKFEGTEYLEVVKDTESPGEAKKRKFHLVQNNFWVIVGREFPLRKDWHDVREDYMAKGVLAKFSQNYDCLKSLLGTIGQDIHNNIPKHDFYWGVGSDGSGKNRLGKILMETRDLLRDNTWDNAIKFYYETEVPYGCFSNYSPHSFKLEGKHWQTSEHYFQAKKYEGTEYEEMVRTAKTPGESKKLGNDRSLPKRKDWQQVKEGFMMKALRAKFTQNEELGEILLGTGERELAEDAKKDSYWGIGLDGSGKNRLGILLMDLRKELKEKK